jgi:hypothetical protein
MTFVPRLMRVARGVEQFLIEQPALEVKYPPVRQIDARERRARVHRRPPSDQPCRVLTGPLRPVDGSPALLGGA